MANQILGDFGKKKVTSKVEPFDLELDKQAPVDLGDFKVEPKPESPGAFDYVEGAARAFDRGILKAPAGAMDIAAATGASLTGADITQDKLYKAARAYEGFVDDKLQSNKALPETGEAIFEGLGQITAQTLAALASGGTSAGAQLVKPVAGMSIAGMGTTEAIRDAVQNKATPAEIQTAAMTGTLSGLTEFLPIERVLGILDNAAPGFRRKVVDIFATGGVEGLQEAAQQGMINFGAQLTYDEERKLTEGLSESVEAGGAVGSIAAAIATLMGAKGVKIKPQDPHQDPHQTDDLVEPVIEGEIVPSNLPTPIRRNVEKIIDAEFEEVTQALPNKQKQLPAPDAPVDLETVEAQAEIDEKIFNEVILPKIKEKYKDNSARQQHAIAYAERKLRGNENTAQPPGVIELGIDSKDTSTRSAKDEIATIKEMMDDPAFEDVRDLLERRLKDFEGDVEEASDIEETPTEDIVAESRPVEPATITVDSMNQAVEDDIVPKTEIIKAREPFSKLGNTWVAPVDDERSLAIEKEGNYYTVYLGTAEELQQGIAQEIDTYSSLPKARKAMGDNVEVPPAPEKLNKEQLKDRLNTLKELNEKKRQDEINALMEEGVDEESAEEFVSFEELSEDEAAEEYYNEKWEEDDTSRDLWDILNDESGKVILERGKRVDATIKQLKRMSTKAGDNYSKLAQQIDKLWKQIKKYLSNQRGSVDINPIAGLAHDLAKRIKALYQGLKDHAVKMKSFITASAHVDKTHTMSQDQQSAEFLRIKNPIKVWIAAYETRLDAVSKAMVDRMKATKRIVPEYKNGTKVPPIRQVPWIYPDVKPEIRPDKKDKVITGGGAFLRSPSFVLKNFFDLRDNPMIDAMEAQMAFTSNIVNGKKWAKDILKGVPNNSAEIQEKLDKIYETAKPVIKARNRNLLKIARKMEQLRTTTDKDTKTKLGKQIAEARKRIRLETAKIIKELTEKYDSVLPVLAAQYAEVRITLQVMEELPSTVQITPEEIAIADKIRDFFEQSKNDLISVGIPVINNRKYMHRLLPDILSDPSAQGFSEQLKIPLNLKFMHQAEDGRVWYPSTHMILDSYIPMVERKIAYQPFLDRWTEAIDRMPTQVQEYMTSLINANLFQQPLKGSENPVERATYYMRKITDSLVMFKYAQLIGLSIPVAFKHGTKIIDTLIMFDAIISGKAIGGMTKATLQKTARSLGYDGDYNELDLIKAYVSSYAMTRLTDELPYLSKSGDLLKRVLGSPVRAVEAADNGVSILATAMAAHNKNISPEQASRIIWETVLQANFRGGWDQPLGFKHPVARLFGMFQMTPMKLMEMRGEVFVRAIKGDLDHLGNPYVGRLIRYILLVGLAEGITRSFGNSIVSQLLHTPFISHWIEASKKHGYEFKEPTFSASPIIDWMSLMDNRGIATGTAESLKYWGQFTRVHNTYNGRFPKNFYKSPLAYNFGIPMVGAGHKKPKRR